MSNDQETAEQPEAPKKRRWRDRVLPSTTAGKATWATALVLVTTMIVVWMLRLFGPDSVRLVHAMTATRVLGELALVIAIPSLLYWGLSRWNRVVEGEYPDIDRAWQAGIEALEAKGIHPADYPLFVILGSADTAIEQGLMGGLGTRLEVAGVPNAAGVRHPLQWYLSDEAIYLFCPGTSSLSALMQRWTAPEAPRRGGRAAITGLAPTAQRPGLSEQPSGNGASAASGTGPPPVAKRPAVAQASAPAAAVPASTLSVGPGASPPVSPSSSPPAAASSTAALSTLAGSDLASTAVSNPAAAAGPPSAFATTSAATSPTAPQPVPPAADPPTGTAASMGTLQFDQSSLNSGIAAPEAADPSAVASGGFARSSVMGGRENAPGSISGPRPPASASAAIRPAPTFQGTIGLHSLDAGAAADASTAAAPPVSQAPEVAAARTPGGTPGRAAETATRAAGTLAAHRGLQATSPPAAPAQPAPSGNKASTARGNGAGEPSTPLALPAALDTSDQIPRLQYVARLLCRVRRPHCGINGVVTLLPFDLSRVGPLQLSAVAQSARSDLTSLQRMLGLRAPVTALMIGMEQDKGFSELTRRLQPSLRSRRLGGRFDLRSRPTPGELNVHSDRLCDAFEDWVYRLFGCDDALSQQRGNRKLFALISRIRHELKPRLRIVLGHAFGCRSDSDFEGQDDEDALFFSGCYFAATGAGGSLPAFVRGVLRDKLLDEQSQVQWTATSLRRDRMLRLASVVGWVCVLILVGLLVIEWLAN